jgi:hypothetical protein
MMFLRPRIKGFLYSESCNIFEVRLPWVTEHEGFLLLLTDEALGMTDEAPGMTDPEGFLPLLTDEAPGMTDSEGFPLFMIGGEGFVLAEGYPPLLAERV